jgi:hypothetical protein
VNGWRAQVHLRDGEMASFSKNGRDLTRRFITILRQGAGRRWDFMRVDSPRLPELRTVQIPALTVVYLR